MTRRTRAFRGNQGHNFAKPMDSTLSWEVKEHEVVSNGIVAGNYKALHRDDNNGLLNIVKKAYKPLTNARFMDTVSRLQKFTGFPLIGYSEFKEGKVLIAYLKSEQDLDIGGFKTKNHMIFGNSFDYSSTVFDGIVNVLMRCSNEFGQINRMHSIRHNQQMDGKIEDLVMYYEKFMETQLKLKETFETWQGIVMSPELKEMFVDKVLGIDSEKKASSVKQNYKIDLYSSIAKEVDEMGDNLWAAFNGVTHYTTHVKNTRERIFGNVTGTLANINKRAYEVSEEILSIV